MCLPLNLHRHIRMNTHTSELNLTTHRAAASVWDRRGWDGTRRELALTRWLVGLGGVALALQGMRQKNVTGSLLAGLGGSLAWWAISGEGDLSAARRWYGAVLERAGWRHADLVHDASAMRGLGWQPQTSLADGLPVVADWIRSQGPLREYYSEALDRLRKTGVVQSAVG